MKKLFTLLIQISQQIPLSCPIHPRTRKNADAIGILHKLKKAPDLLLLDPLNYVRFMNLVFNCRFALTDSGGIQEETTYMGIPCITLRPNTERPITITLGTNRLSHLEGLKDAVNSVLAETKRPSNKIDLWDGRTAQRVVKSIKHFLR